MFEKMKYQKKIKLKCKNCYKDFNIMYCRYKLGKGKFCSQKCYFEHKQCVVVKCEYCNKTFEKKPSRLGKRKEQFCNYDCYLKYMKEKGWVKLNCKQCKKDYEIRMHEYKRGRGKYCSRQCYFKHKEAVFVEIKCKWCNNTKLARELYVKRGQYKFCSDKCRQEAQRYGIPKEKLQRTCEACGSNFNIKPKELGKRRHCSKKCSHRREILTCKQCNEKYEHTVSDISNKIFCSMSCYHRFKGESSIETIVRKYLESSNVEYNSQVQFGRFTVDFLIPSKKLIIEADGKYWHSKSDIVKERDERKNKYLNSLGYKLVRLKEDDITNGNYEKDLKTCLN